MALGRWGMLSQNGPSGVFLTSDRVMFAGLTGAHRHGVDRAEQDISGERGVAPKFSSTVLANKHESRFMGRNGKTLPQRVCD